LERQRDEAREEGRKKLKAGDRNGAVFYLRRMKMIEKELSSLYGKRANLDTLVRTLEAATFDKSLIQAMTAGHHATKQLVRDDEVDRVQDMIADLQEDMSRVEEIGNALAEVSTLCAVQLHTHMISRFTSLHSCSSYLMLPLSIPNSPSPLAYLERGNRRRGAPQRIRREGGECCYCGRHCRCL